MSLTDISREFTETTLTEIVKKAGGTIHTSYKFGKTVKKGDSYLSKVFRLSVYGINEDNGRTMEVHLIVKAMPQNMARRAVFRSADFFRNEINFYAHVIPAWERFQKRRSPQRAFKEYPVCYASYCDGENDFIALEDVNVFGYSSPIRQECISLEECVLTMSTLGRFHGISLAFSELEPEEFEKTCKCLEETYFAEKYRSWYKDFLESAFIVARDAIKQTYPATKCETIADNFLQENLYDDLISLVSTKSKLSVVTHGDCWTPNFLTRCSPEDRVEAIIMIDFQLARFASLALDISFFMYSCVSQSLRESHYETLLKTYHESASKIISDLGADPEKALAWSELLKEIKDVGRFGCGMGIESLPMSMLEDDEVKDLDEITVDTKLSDVWDIKPFKDARKRQRIADMFKHAVDLGYLK
uniref:CHK kinase-like domain-containing protein n=1 Tax=Glossina morsitans morsitans TaxID=37546 RepID=A0A1B0FD05_GLOMM